MWPVQDALLEGREGPSALCLHPTTALKRPHIERWALTPAPARLARLIGSRGGARARSSMAQAALARCQLEAAEHPDSAAARFTLGVALGESGDLRGSIEAYEEALRLDADDADTHYNLALCYETLGPEGTERAIAAYRRTLALAPSADAWTNLGVLFHC